MFWAMGGAWKVQENKHRVSPIAGLRSKVAKDGKVSRRIETFQESFLKISGSMNVMVSEFLIFLNVC